MIRQHIFAPILCGLVLIAGTAAAAAPIPKHNGKAANMSKPVNVFIMMGQSNMIGFGRVKADAGKSPEGSLENAVKEKKNYPYLVDDDGQWTVRKDVRFVQMIPGKGLQNDDWLGIKNSVGVEIGIGHVIGNAVDAPVLLVKSCTGNRALGWHLLPPGSARFEEGDTVYAGYRDGQPSWAKGTEPKQATIYDASKENSRVVKGDKPELWYAGQEYDFTVGDARKMIAALDKHYPGAKGCEVAGFFYWQGEKDADHPVYAAQYEKNLVQLIKALRKDFNAPNAKFVLGTIGDHKKGAGGNRGKLLEAQLAVDGTTGKYPEFKGNVATIYTHPMAQGQGGNGHYDGNAEVYMDVGEAMGQAMVEMLKK